jgi:hypothetical protein
MQCPNCSGKRVSDAPRRLNPKTRQTPIPFELVLLGSILLLAALGVCTVWSRRIFPYSDQLSVFIRVGYGVILGLFAAGVGYWCHYGRAHAVYIHRYGCVRCGYRWQWRGDHPYQAPFIPEPPMSPQTLASGKQQPAWEERKERQESYRSLSHSIYM